MNHIKKAVELAVQGGWKYPKYYDNLSEAEKWHLLVDLPHEAILDPTFWKAIGVSLGWTGAYCYMCQTDVAVWGECNCDEDEVTPVAQLAWQYKQHQFLTHLQSGKSIDDSLRLIE